MIKNSLCRVQSRVNANDKLYCSESSFLKNYFGPSLGHATFSHPEDKMNRLKDWDAFDQWTPAPQPVTGAPIEYECGFKDCELYEDAYEDYY